MKSNAPALSARTDIGMSPCPVTRITGGARLSLWSFSMSSRPDSPGIRTSSTMQPGRAWSYALRNDSAESNVSTLFPTDPMRKPRESRIAGSSSTTKTVG